MPESVLPSKVFLSELLRFLHVLGKDASITVRTGRKVGWLFIVQGQLLDAMTTMTFGEDAAISILTWEKATISVTDSASVNEPTIESPLELILDEVQSRLRRLTNRGNPLDLACEVKEFASTLLYPFIEYTREETSRTSEEDEQHHTQHRDSAQRADLTEQATMEEPTEVASPLPWDIPSTPPSPPSRDEVPMAEVTIEDELAHFELVDGFLAAGVFTWDGEQIAMIQNSGAPTAMIGESISFINDVLYNAQRVTELIGVGRGNLIHMETPDTQIIALCFNESSDFRESTSGKAHFHIVLLLEMDGNVALGKTMCEQVAKKLAPVFR